MGTTFESYGVRFGLRASDAATLARLRERLPPGARESAGGVVPRLYSLRAAPPPRESERGRLRRFHLLYGDLARLARTDDLEEALARFESDLQLYVAEGARGRLFVHAGVVGWRGRAILLPGRTYSGKSTLVSELVRAGAVYYSDEYAVLDRRGRVHPYARPLHLREGETGRRRRVGVDSLKGKAGVRPLPVGLVVAARYRPGARFRPRAMTPGQGLLELLANTVAARREPEAALDTLRAVAETARLLRGARGEARGAAATILEAAGD